MYLRFTRAVRVVTLALLALTVWAWVRSGRHCDVWLVEWTAKTRVFSNRGAIRIVRDDARGSCRPPPAGTPVRPRPSVRWSATAVHRPVPPGWDDMSAVGWDGLATPVRGAAGFGAAIDQSRSDVRRTVLVVPHGFVVAALSVPVLWWAMAAMRRRRQWTRSRRGLCPACGFDLRGGHDRCPECGRPVGPPPRPPWRPTRRSIVTVATVAAAGLVGYGGARVARHWAGHRDRTVEAIIADVCVDDAGDFDPSIADGDWRPWMLDLDLNGDGQAERVVLFYPWQKDGNTQAEADAHYRSWTTGHGKTAYGAMAMLILGRRGSGWEPLGYYMGGDDWEMQVTIDPTVRPGMTAIWTVTGLHNNVLTMWGAGRPGGRVGPLPGWTVPHLGPAGAVPRFAVRSWYPK